MQEKPTLIKPRKSRENRVFVILERKKKRCEISLSCRQIVHQQLILFHHVLSNDHMSRQKMWCNNRNNGNIRSKKMVI